MARKTQIEDHELTEAFANNPQLVSMFQSLASATALHLLSQGFHGSPEALRRTALATIKHVAELMATREYEAYLQAQREEIEAMKKGAGQ